MFAFDQVDSEDFCLVQRGNAASDALLARSPGIAGARRPATIISVSKAVKSDMRRRAPGAPLRRPRDIEFNMGGAYELEDYV